ncbi:ribonuclease FAU-1 family protein [Halorubrum pallidum]
MNARVRGIYTTALTRLLLEADHEVVDASAPIRRRFDAAFPNVPPDVRVETTADRQGVGAYGDPEATAVLRDLLAGVGLDTLAWTDPTPPGAVLDGEVTETLGGGAVVRLRVDDEGAEDTEGGDPATAEGYLPYGDVDDRVESGDPVRVQVRASAAPWTDRRPELDGSLRVGGDLVALEPGSGTRVDVRNDAAARELSGMVDLLGLEPPDGWRAAWKPPAVDAGTDELDAGLRRAVEATERLDSAVDAAGGVGVLDDRDRLRDGPIATPNAGFWVWFGRESRFGLDGARREVTATMPGHHRVKAGAADASAGVDLAEALCEPDPDAEFPFGVVTDAFGPNDGDALRIEHGKPDGRVITLGEGTVTAVEADGTVTVEREMTGGGTYDGLGVQREAGDVAETSLKEGRWWYPTTYRGGDGTVRGTYVNVCTPVEVFPDAARYVDLHVDVVKRPDGTVERVDDDVLRGAVAADDVSEPLAEKARSVAEALENAL